MSKLKLMGKNHSDELYTPEGAINILLPYLKQGSTIWECAFGTGKLAEYLRDKGFIVVGDTYADFFDNTFFNKYKDCAYIITNPPFSQKIKFIEECYRREKPFALLLPLTTLEGIKIQKMFQEKGIQILFPRGRIDFNGKKAPWFYTCWFTYGLNLPKELNYDGIPPKPKVLGILPTII